MATITVQPEYGYVVLVATSTFFLGFWHGARVIGFRKPAGIPYPHHMATAEQMASATPEKRQAMYLFNCAQRAHYNFMENHTSFVIAMLIAGLKYPVASAAAGAVWCISRILYATGYTRKDKERGSGRVAGVGFWLAQLAVFVMSGMVGYQTLKA